MKRSAICRPRISHGRKPRTTTSRCRARSREYTGMYRAFFCSSISSFYDVGLLTRYTGTSAPAVGRRR